MPHLLAISLLLLLVACGGGGGGGGGGSTSSGSTPVVWNSATSSSISSYKTTEYNNQYGLNQINAAEAYAALATNSKTVAGSGVTIAIVDTGVKTDHVEIAGNYQASGSYDYISDDSDPSDDNGHGSNVASIAAGVADGSTGSNAMHGVAYDSKIIAIKVLNSAGSGNSTGLASGIDKVVSDEASDDKIKVMNLSVGLTGASSDVRDAIISAKNSGILTVAATGNDGDSQPDYPAHYASDSGLLGYVIAVAAVDSGSEIATSSSDGFSSNYCGDAKDYCLVAPGVEILGAYKDNTTSYAYYSGTSQATPHVSGAAAVIRAAWPFLTAPQTTQILLTTATDLGDSGVDAVYGHGLLNLYAAVQAQGQNTLSYGTGISSGGYSVTSSSLVSDPIFGDAFSANVAPQLNSAIFFDDYGRDYKAFLGNKISERKTSSLANLSALAFNNYRTQTIPLSFGKNFSSQLQFQVKSYSENSAPNQFGLKFLTTDKSRVDAVLNNTNGFSFTQNFGKNSDKNFWAGFAFNRDEISASRSDKFGNFGFLSVNNFAANPFQSFVSGVATASGSQKNFNQFFVTHKFLDQKFTLNFSQQTSYQGASQVTSQGASQGTSIVSKINNVENRISDLNLVYVPNDATKFSFSWGNLNEFNNNILNSKALGAFESAGVSKTSYFKISASKKIAENFSLISSFSEGATTIRGNNFGIFRDYSNIRSRSSSLGLVGEKFWGGKVGLVYSEPLRVYSGKANINVPIARDFDGNLTRYSATVSLKPQGREQDLEIFYSRNLVLNYLSDAALKFNLVAQKQPGNVKAASNSYLAFVNFGGKF